MRRRVANLCSAGVRGGPGQGGTRVLRCKQGSPLPQTQALLRMQAPTSSTNGCYSGWRSWSVAKDRNDSCACPAAAAFQTQQAHALMALWTVNLVK